MIELANTVPVGEIETWLDEFYLDTKDLWVDTVCTEVLNTRLFEADPERFLAKYSIDVTATTDTRPYFFFHVRPRSLLDPQSIADLQIAARTDSRGSNLRSTLFALLLIDVKSAEPRPLGTTKPTASWSLPRAMSIRTRHPAHLPPIPGPAKSVVTCWIQCSWIR